jgi:SAM-dependent methyltransferase
MNIVLRKMRSAWIRARRNIVSQRFGFPPEKIYAASFYEDGGFARTEASARVMTAWIHSTLKPRSVLDLGSGAGHYLRAFARLGVESLGLEASPSGVSKSGDDVLALTYDLRRPLHVSRRFDVVMCVEVAEHIPNRSSAVLVESICSSAGRFVIFTAAPPGTPGADHINCQSTEFWTALFRAKGFCMRGDLTTDLRRTAEIGDAAQWWKSWSWCFEREPSPGDGPTFERGR